MTVRNAFGGAPGQLSPPLEAVLGDWGGLRSADALARVLKAPNVSLDEHASPDLLAKAVVDCVDACAFGEPHHVYLTAKNVTDALAQRGALDFVPGLREGLEHLRSRSAIFLDPQALRAYFNDPARSGWGKAAGVVLLAEQERRPMTDAEAARALSALPASEHAAFRRWLFFVQGNVLFRAVKPGLHTALGAPSRPDTPLTYGGGPSTDSIVAALEAAYADGRVPVLFFEPYDLDWARVRAAIAGKPALFLLRHGALLGHALQFPQLFESLLDPHHALYTLQAFPEEALREQPALAAWAASRSEGRLFAPIAFDEGMRERARTLRAVELLERWLRVRVSDPTAASGAAYWLYRFTLALQDELNLQRLGGARAFAYLNGAADAAWTSPHKGLAPAEASADLAFPDRVEPRLAPHRSARKARALRETRPLRLAHVVPLVVDGGHAPTRLLRTLMDHHDRARFEPHVFVTERLTMRKGDYPMSDYCSEPSRVRGVGSLGVFEYGGFHVEIDDATVGFEASGVRLAERLSAAGIDVAVFHGPDFINLVAAQCTDVPVRVFFDHGSPPGHEGFDLVVAATDDAAKAMAGSAALRRAKVVANTYFVNARELWKPAAYPMSTFDVPDDAQILTTISNHLESRLGDEMCAAIAEILRRNPRAWYMPIGLIANAQELARRFERHGAPNRIRFIGPSNEPSQLARSMKLFLNEFPFGSGLAILDAMAAGCPVVTMYDPEGPPQARFGGIYMGIDRAVTSLRREDYVDLACRLLNDDALYAEWSREALARYEARTDLQGYLRRFEDFIDDYLRERGAEPHVSR